MSGVNEGINVEKAVFTEDVKIIIDIESIAEKYGSFRESYLRIYSIGKNFIDFSFMFSTILFSEQDLDSIKRYVKKLGYDYLHFLAHSSEKHKPIHLSIRMQVSSKKRKLMGLVKWVYYLPKRIYWRYRFWRNYGTWRYR